MEKPIPEFLKNPRLPKPWSMESDLAERALALRKAKIAQSKKEKAKKLSD